MFAIQRNDLTDLQIEQILEAAIFAAGEPVSVAKLSQLFSEDNSPEVVQIKERLTALAGLCEDRGVELVEVSSGYRFPAKSEWAPWMQKMWEKRPPRYSRALLETIALIAYKQPITRGEIEQVRGVAVSSNIIKTLMEREWIKIVGYREVPGRPALLGSTRKFLDYFNLKSITDLPVLDDITDLDEVAGELSSQLTLEIEASSDVEQAQLETVEEEMAVITQESSVDLEVDSLVMSAAAVPNEPLIDEETMNVEAATHDATLQDTLSDAEQDTHTNQPVTVTNEITVDSQNKEQPTVNEHQEITEDELETV